MVVSHEAVAELALASMAMRAERAESVRVQATTLKELSLGTPDEQSPVRITSHLPPPFRADLFALIRFFKDVFPWAHTDLLGLGIRLYQHKINLKQDTKPVQQQRGESLSRAAETPRRWFHSPGQNDVLA